MNLNKSKLVTSIKLH